MKNIDERETLDKLPNSTVAQRDAAINLLIELSNEPDDFIKHHELANNWLKRVRSFLAIVQKDESDNAGG